MSVTGQGPLPAGQAVGFGSVPLRALFDVGTLTGLTDGQLLERFTLGKRELAEAAFTLLVQRHGPMVLRVCQQVLGDPHDAEDVFQATFLLLARKAGSIRREDAVASWVYGVARRLSLRSRRLAARRQELEHKRLVKSGPTKPLSGSPPDLWPELYEELDRLPQPFRAAIVLCDLEGNTYEQAAGMLHCPVGTIQSRLFRGRQRLRRGLERRGLGSALALGGGRLPLASMTPGVPKRLTASLAHSAVSLAQGQPIGGAISATVVTLMGSELKREVLRRFLTASIAVVVAGLMVAGAVGLMFGQGERGAKARGAVASPNARLHAAPINVHVVDIQGRPVPGAKVNAVEFSFRAPIQNFTTDLQGRVEIPRVNLDLQLLARGQDGSLAWAQVGYRQPDDQPESTQADPLVMKLVPLDHIAQGSVVDPSGQPIAGAEVMAQGFQAPHGVWVSFMFRSADLPLPRSVTDQAGRFTINLPSGAEANVNVRHARFLGPGKVIGASDKSVEPFVLEPAGGIAGRVIDATGQPVPRAFVGVQLTEYRTRILGGWGETQTDDQGRFAITGLEPGVYNLLFEEAPGRLKATARAVEGLRVQAGHNTAALMKVIEGRPLHGTVIDQATNQPVVGIDVGCYGPARPRSGAAVDSRKTDATGRFTFYVPAGEQYVYLMDGNSYSRLSRSTVEVPEDGEIEPVRLIRIGLSASSQSSRYTMKAVIRPSEPAKAKAEAKPKEKRDVADNKAVPAAALRTLTGRVLGPSGEPLAGIQVTVDPGMRAPDAEPEHYDTAATDREGVFILSGLPRRPLQINLHRLGFHFQTENVPADNDDIKYTYQLKPDASSKFRPPPRKDDPVPADRLERVTFVDLSPRGTEFLADGPGGMGNDLSRLTRGVRQMEDLFFLVGESIAHAQGQLRGDLPGEIKGIKVGGRGQVLHLLHATQMGAAAGTEVGAYVVHYADGSVERIPLVYGRNIVDWYSWQRPGVHDAPTGARVVWTGSNDSTELNSGLKIRLIAQTWTNPHPEKEIATLDIISANTLCEPFLVAATLERPD